MTPTNVKITPQTTFGSATDVKPLRVGSVILFLQRAGRKLREYAYQFDTDSFVAPNMNVLADHVTESGVVDPPTSRNRQIVMGGACRWGARRHDIRTHWRTWWAGTGTASAPASWSR